ncbi:tRNA (5-methylaminomethyl-2-thiouridylate)-methyltransferase [Helicobacter fennelliae]|uniref:tRNA-specific 2-thiouridylase MnmA n=1 Tax=Helicobacter fennelliae TaxID=215 RepID=A0A2X3B2N7_9HELI|nr:tRNA 2-thiouridine(34) synthase MnmA [Helicobacter fennelliae]SQB98162.1 tRNA (5-methylaminomethyl-2-thiouridylate)-methyltransferase [Helicobacter fennelliae]
MKVALLMSGGVDSSYSAYLLKSSGYEVLGIYLKLHDKEDKHEMFIRNCQKVSQNLDFPFMVIDAKKEFKEIIYDYFVQSYKNGETPNPCALCNPNMKFGLALQKALELNCDKIATGHYAKIKQVDGKNKIARAVDLSKDQSYFLYAISQEAIDRLIFPLGDMLKSDVKPKAFEVMPWLGSLETYKESQEICFVETDYIDILKKHTKVENPGIVKNAKGEIVGEHKGYMQYTIGKRKGFSVKGAHEPHFVLDINPKNNEIVVGTKQELAKLLVQANNISLPKDFDGKECDIKIRYRSEPTKALIQIQDDKIIAKLKEPVFGVAKGQALVVYEQDCVLGGGVIQ